MLTLKAIQHCSSVGKDKCGLTMCRACAPAIRKECIKPSAFTAEGLKDHAMRVNRAVEDHYKGCQ